MLNSKKSQVVSAKKTAYLIGIKGVGMTALAQVLRARGWSVSGSDTHERFFTDAVLERHGITMHDGFSGRRIAVLATSNAKHHTPSPLIIASSAYGNTNPEVREAMRRGLRVHAYSEVLGKLFNEQEGIAVCGSHGKTTTSALLGWVFKKAGLGPTVVVGSEVLQFGGNAIAGRGKYFIAETDEYQNKLRYFKPKAVLLTNIDYDHPDFFKTRAAYRNAFRAFIARLPKNGLLVACGDDAEVLKVFPAAKARVVTFSLNRVQYDKKLLSNSGKLESGLENTWEARSIMAHGGRWAFDAYKNGKKFGAFSLRLAGRHNVQNALGVIALSHAYGVSKRLLRQALVSFRGTRRRFERVGMYHGAMLIDDYAHHPTEISATLRATRELHPDKRIIAVFHPHTYSRTKSMLNEFAAAFTDADEVIVLDVYGSARERTGTVGSKELVQEMSKRHVGARHIPTIERAIAYLRKHLKKTDVLITLGAGDVWRVAAGLTRPGAHRILGDVIG